MLSDQSVEAGCIDSLEGFVALKDDWCRLYEADQDAGFFLSWHWLASVFERYPGRWRVVTARKDGPDGTLIGALPVSYRARWSESRQQFVTLLEAGGKLGLGEYSGFICDADAEGDAVSAIASRLADMPWFDLSLRYEPTGRRGRRFMKTFPAKAFKSGFHDYRINEGRVDNLLCPTVILPDSFETYLDSLSSNTRQKVRRFQRRKLDAGEWRITNTSKADAGTNIELLLDLWTRQWADLKGNRRASEIAEKYRRMMMTANDLNALHLPVIWEAGQPIAALGCVADHSKKEMHFVLAGRNTMPETANAGLLLHTHSIRWAIEHEFSRYCFGHGDEAYKYSLGGEDHQTYYIRVRRSSQTQTNLFDTFTTPLAIRRIQSMLKKDKTKDAYAACASLTGTQ